MVRWSVSLVSVLEMRGPSKPTVQKTSQTDERHKTALR